MFHKQGQLFILNTSKLIRGYGQYLFFFQLLQCIGFSKFGTKTLHAKMVGKYSCIIISHHESLHSNSHSTEE